MAVLRSVAAVVLGFVTMAVIVMAGTMAAVAVLVPGGLAAAMKAPPATPSARYLATNLIVSFAAAVAGGWVAARVAPRAPVAHLLALAALLLVMSLVTAATGETTGQPAWYPWTIAVLGLAGVAAGGYLRAR